MQLRWKWVFETKMSFCSYSRKRYYSLYLILSFVLFLLDNWDKPECECFLFAFIYLLHSFNSLQHTSLEIDKDSFFPIPGVILGAYPITHSKVPDDSLSPSFVFVCGSGGGVCLPFLCLLFSYPLTAPHKSLSTNNAPSLTVVHKGRQNRRSIECLGRRLPNTSCSYTSRCWIFQIDLFSIFLHVYFWGQTRL